MVRREWASGLGDKSLSPPTKNSDHSFQANEMIPNISFSLVLLLSLTRS